MVYWHCSERRAVLKGINRNFEINFGEVKQMVE